MTNVQRHYLTNEELMRVQRTELELLIEFDRICRKHGIIYSLDGGTLLGAVRHGGFIPWDDDADVIMNRIEYEKLIKILDKELDIEKFYFQDINRTPGYRWGYAKLRRKGSKFIRTNQYHLPYEQGIFLDIFVCDNVPEFYPARVIVNFHSFLYRKKFYSVVGVKNSTGLARLIYKLLAKIPEEKLKKDYNKYVCHRNKKDSRYSKCLTFPACNRFFGYKKEWYSDVEERVFENHSFLACKKYDEYLSFLYGDYMKLPDIENRKAHPVIEVQFVED